MLAADYAMGLIPETLDQMMNGDLAPWKDNDLTENDYRKMVRDLDQESTDFPCHYNFPFPRPFSPKTWLYNRLIRILVKREVAHYIWLVGQDGDEEGIRKRIRYVLDECLEPNLVRIGRLIKERDYSAEWLNITQAKIDKAKITAPKAYATRMLGRGYAMTYLEVQRTYAGYVVHMLEPEDVYSMFIGEPTDPAPIQLLSKAEGRNGKESKGNTPDPGQVSRESFTYLGYNRDPKKLEDAWNSLRNSGLIAKETTRDDFERIFSGKPVITPVRWTGFTSDLYSFIYLVHTKYQLVRHLKKDVWAVTCKCFVRKDGRKFKRNAFRGLHPSIINKPIIDNAVENLRLH